MLHCCTHHELSKFIYKEHRDSPKDVAAEAEHAPVPDAKAKAETASPQPMEQMANQPLAPEIIKVQQETRFSIGQFIKNLFIDPAKKVFHWVKQNTYDRMKRG